MLFSAHNEYLFTFDVCVNVSIIFPFSWSFEFDIHVYFLLIAQLLLV